MFERISTALAENGVTIVFLNVLLEQLGLPIPALPTLIVAGALVVDGTISPVRLLGGAALACLLADTAYYLIGMRHGQRLLSTLCKLSLSPESCVRQTQMIFERFGLPSLLVAKFIPGFSTVAPPLAGARRARLASFLLFDAGGSLLWAGSGILIGAVFHPVIEQTLSFLARLGAAAFLVAAAALALFILWKWLKRRRFLEMLRMARITPGELRSMLDSGSKPLILDVRTRWAHMLDPRRIPGARVLEIAALESEIPNLPTDSEIVLYCT